jgi:glucose dehydrogenase
MKKLLLIISFLLVACSGENTSYSLNCEGVFTEISESGTMISTNRQKRQYEINQNQMAERRCTKEGSILSCYKEIEYPNLQRAKEQFYYNTGDYSLSDVSVRIGVDNATGKPVFIKTELFRSTCPMTVKHEKKSS